MKDFLYNICLGAFILSIIVLIIIGFIYIFSYYPITPFIGLILIVSWFLGGITRELLFK
jgi:hypothetical protein